MVSRHYDVVILGRTLSALTAAAVLARRDFRVLLLGQGQFPASYQFDRHRLRRRATPLLFGHSPVWRKILHDLGQTQTFRQRTRALDPMFVLMSETRRIEVPPDPEAFGREIEREFSEVAGLVDELYARIAAANEAIDQAFEREAVWPPGNWLERLESSRVASALPFTRSEAGIDLLDKFPSRHPFRELVTVPAVFSADLAPGLPLPPLALARLHGSWTRGVHTLDGGPDELEDFLVERIRAHGGQCRFDSRANGLILRRGRIVGVVEDGEDEAIGTDAVLCAMSGEQVADMTAGEGVTKTARQSWPKLTATAHRFVTSLVVETKALPEPLGQEAFVLPPKSAGSTVPLPQVHLERFDGRGESGDESLLVAEMLLPRSGGPSLSEARRALLGTLGFHMPHLDEHLLAVDSPHDGLPAWDFSTGEKREIDRIHLKVARTKGEPMDPLWSCDPSGYLAIGAEPLRGPIPGSYMIGQTVLPGLGQEGQLLAAWSVARLLTKKDSVRQKRRHQMWSKVETNS